MTKISPTRRNLLLGLVALTGLAGCGKKGDLAPPEGEEDLYTYPRNLSESRVPGARCHERQSAPEHHTGQYLDLSGFAHQDKNLLKPALHRIL